VGPWEADFKSSILYGFANNGYKMKILSRFENYWNEIMFGWFSHSGLILEWKCLWVSKWIRTKSSFAIIVSIIVIWHMFFQFSFKNEILSVEKIENCCPLARSSSYNFCSIMTSLSRLNLFFKRKINYLLKIGLQFVKCGDGEKFSKTQKHTTMRDANRSIQLPIMYDEW